MTIQLRKLQYKYGNTTAKNTMVQYTFDNRTANGTIDV